MSADPRPQPEPLELHTVTDREVVGFAGASAQRWEGLEPSTEYVLGGVAVTTLATPPGELLAVVATVNDVHFGEVECGRMDGHDIGPVLTAAEGAEPYPEVMNAAIVEEIAALGPDAVVAKGDLTSEGTAGQAGAFEACYGRLGDRLVTTLGNHDHPAGGPCLQVDPVQVRDVGAVRLAVLDTTVAGQGGGRLAPAVLDELDAVVAAWDGPVLLFGHHPIRPAPTDPAWLADWAALDAGSTEALVDLAVRHPQVAGYWAGHTHRNRVLRRPETGPVPFAEVASAKDFPGSWAEYRVHEGGLLAVHHRVASPAALAWSEACRALVFGLYPRFALGELADRCYAVPFRRRRPATVPTSAIHG